MVVQHMFLEVRPGFLSLLAFAVSEGTYIPGSARIPIPCGLIPSHPPTTFDEELGSLVKVFVRIGVLTQVHSDCDFDLFQGLASRC